MNLPTAEFIQDFTRLENIFDASGGPNSWISPSHVLSFINHNERWRWIRSMESQGLLQREDRMNPGVKLTPKGRDIVVNGIKVRNNTRTFKYIVRSQLLDWVLSHSSGEDDFWDVGKSISDFWVFGRKITPRDLLEATNSLQARGLIKCIPYLTASSDSSTPVIQVSIAVTREMLDEGVGIDINVSRIKQKEKIVSGPIFNIDSVYGGNIVAGNGNTITSIVAEQNTQKIIALGESLRRTIPILDLDELQQSEAYDCASALEKAQDPSKVRIALEKIKDSAFSSASDTIMSLLADKACEILKDMPL